MKVSGARHCKTWDPAPAPWNEFAVMGWQVCFQASKRIFHSFSTFRAFPALPGAVRGTFMERDCIRHMNFSFMRRPIIRAAICTRAAYAKLRMKHAIVFQLEILRDCAAPGGAMHNEAGTQKERVSLMHHAEMGGVILILLEQGVE